MILALDVEVSEPGGNPFDYDIRLLRVNYSESEGDDGSWPIEAEKNFLYFGNVQEIQRKIEEADIVVMHDAKYVMNWLSRYGADFSYNVMPWCTQLYEFSTTAQRSVEMTKEELFERHKETVGNLGKAI